MLRIQILSQRIDGLYYPDTLRYSAVPNVKSAAEKTQDTTLFRLSIRLSPQVGLELNAADYTSYL